MITQLKWLKMKFTLTTIAFCLSVQFSYAENNKVTPFLELPNLNLPDIQPKQPQIQPNLSLQSEQQNREKPPELNDDDLKQNLQLTEYIINQALLNKDWNTLARIIKFYPAMQGADPMLVKYIQGALYRQQGKHKQAIAAYQWMMDQEADLTMVRFDLAAMQFENKQYKDARKNFEMVSKAQDLPEYIQGYLQQYLMVITQQLEWSGSLELSAMYNDNVNQTSAERYINFGGLIFEKNTANLPKSAYGTGYDFTLNRQWNLQTHHFLTLSGQVAADFYDDASEYNEITAQLKTGYKFQNIKSWLKIEPMLSQRILDHDSYSQDWGVATEYGYILKPDWQLMANYLWSDRNYQSDDLLTYAGKTHAFSTTAVHFLHPNQVIFAGLSHQIEQLQDKSESSKRYGIQLGLIQQWQSGWNLRTNLGYAYRKFEDINIFNPQIRKDKELQANFSLGQQAWQWNGFSPKLNYSYVNIDSNREDLYSRKNHQIALSVESNF